MSNQHQYSVKRNDALWMRRDRDEKMNALYGFPVDLPEAEEDALAPARGIILSVAFCVLCGLGVISYLIFTNQ